MMRVEVGVAGPSAAVSGVRSPRHHCRDGDARPEGRDEGIMMVAAGRRATRKTACSARGARRR